MTGAKASRVTLVLVDGSNVARCTAWRARMGAAADDVLLRRRLVDAIVSWAGRLGHEACITFDGAGPWRAGSTTVAPGVEVVGSGGREGDEVVEQRARQAGRAGRSVWVVTSDVPLQRVAGAHADRTIAADAFVAELDVAQDPSGDEPRSAQDASPGSPLAGALSPEVRARLEQLRRGQS